MNKIVLTIVLIAILLGGGYAFVQSQKSTQTTNPTPNPSTTEPTTAQSEPSTEISGTVKEFTVEGKNFSFTPATMAVNKGDTVKITFKNSGGMHDLTLDEFNVKTKPLADGESETVEFTADQAGTFEYYCSVGNHRAMGMKGTLTVK